MTDFSEAAVLLQCKVNGASRLFANQIEGVTVGTEQPLVTTAAAFCLNRKIASKVGGGRRWHRETPSAQETRTKLLWRATARSLLAVVVCGRLFLSQTSLSFYEDKRPVSLWCILRVNMLMVRATVAVLRIKSMWQRIIFSGPNPKPLCRSLTVCVHPLNSCDASGLRSQLT